MKIFDEKKQEDDNMSISVMGCGSCAIPKTTTNLHEWNEFYELNQFHRSPRISILGVRFRGTFVPLGCVSDQISRPA